MHPCETAPLDSSYKPPNGRVSKTTLKRDTFWRLGHTDHCKKWHANVERISFLDALRWLNAPGTGRPLVALIVNPIRPHQVEPRVKKRRPKPFPLMITPRQALRQQLLQHACRS
jgi:hypothetical protein